MPHLRPLGSLLLAPAVVLLCALPSAARTVPRLGTWNLPEQHAVRTAGLMHDEPDARFHGERPLAGTDLRNALTILAGELEVAPEPVRAGRLTVTAFDRLLVAQLGAGPVAAAVQSQAFRAGLHPPRYFGTEVVARQLGLRGNHPDPYDALELYPDDAITRAEAAHSLAVALRWEGGAAEAMAATFSTFVLPRYSQSQLRPLRLAVAKIGMPYVWGGETDTASSFFGGQVHGGYDCSGFAWRVFKLSGLPAGQAILGRTAAQQAGEIPRAQRIPAQAVQPADLVFFGPGRIWQRATERRIVHEGIALSNVWMIHDSGQGVQVSSLQEEWRAREFSWARRVL